MWFGAAYFAAALGIGGVMIVLIGWPVLVASAADNPKRRVRGLFTVSLGLAGYFVAGIVTVFASWDSSADWLASPLVGLLLGLLLGNVVGRVAWIWLKPNHEEARV